MSVCMLRWSCMQDYALADYRQFADLDEMRLNAHNIVNMYNEGDYVKVVQNFVGIYMWKRCTAKVLGENM